jgi:ketosteroid isomerase-like protein
MSSEENVRIVKKFFEAMARGNVQGLLALSTEDIEWIIPGEGWPLAGTLRGHAELRDFPQKVFETMESSFPSPPAYVAQGDRVLMISSGRGRIKATNKTFEDDSAIAITVRNGKVTNIREYIDTQAVARASEMDESPRHSPIDTEIAQSAL